MKNKWLSFITLLAILGILFNSSCATKDPTFGTLTVYAYDTNGQVIPNLQINLAESLVKLKAGEYILSGWTDSTGKIYFGDLAPVLYWYGAQGFDDYGAIQVFAGNDFYVHYFPNTIHQGIK